MTDEFALPVISPVDVADWRIATFDLYARVRMIAETDPLSARALWRADRDEMFASHPASPLLGKVRGNFDGLDYFDYDPAFRFVVEIEAAPPESREVATGTDGVVTFERIGIVRPGDLGSLDVWRLTGYGGGLFIPVKDALAGQDGGTYGAGRYLIDTIKGAHLGFTPPTLVLDFNFAYNPSCVYDPRWLCPLAGPGNTLGIEIPAGEQVSSGAL